LDGYLAGKIKLHFSPPYCPADNKRNDRMMTRHAFSARCQRLSSLPQLNLALCAVTALTVACPGRADSPGKEPAEKPDLPEISAFVTKRSDRFLVDIKEVSRDHPLLGVNSPHPHG
jgi:hypothetical protein